MNILSNADSIGIALKGRRTGSGWIVRCPCAGHGNGRGDKRPSLSVSDGDDGRLLLNCFGDCKFIDVLDALKRLGLVDAQARSDRAPPRLRIVASQEHQPDEDAIRIWRAAGWPVGTVVQEYLERRGIPITPASIRCGTYLHAGERFPCMVVAVQRPDGKVVAVQRTILTLRGEKAPVPVQKITTGALGAGAVRFAPAAKVMGIAEGAETALAALIMADIPVWASLGCQRLDRVELPEFVREVHFFVDNDDSGRANAQKAGEMHQKLGRRVTLRFPPEHLKDYNDLLIENAEDDELRDREPSCVTGGAA